MSKVNRYFDTSVAKEVGTDAAIILYNLEFWIEKNKVNGKHFYDGKYWTYNSVRAFQELFDWLSVQNIKTCLNKLESKGYIVTGNYNEKKYDNTKWYALGKQLTEENPLLESTKALVRINQPIPDNKPDNNNNSNIKDKSLILSSEEDSSKKQKEKANKENSKLRGIQKNALIKELETLIGYKIPLSSRLKGYYASRLLKQAELLAEFRNEPLQIAFKGFLDWFKQTSKFKHSRQFTDIDTQIPIYMYELKNGLRTSQDKYLKGYELAKKSLYDCHVLTAKIFGDRTKAYFDEMANHGEGVMLTYKIKQEDMQNLFNSASEGLWNDMVRFYTKDES